MSFYDCIGILLRNNTLSYGDVLEKLSEMSDCQIDVAEFNKWYTDNITDKQNNILSVSDKTDRQTTNIGTPLSQEALLLFIKDTGAAGYPKEDFCEKYGDEACAVLLKAGRIVELTRGALRWSAVAHDSADHKEVSCS